MTDEDRPESGESGGSRQRWAHEAQEALDRTGDAVRTAWESTRESRLSALESAKRAVKDLGDVLEKGVEAARERWEAEGNAHESEPATPPASPTETTPGRQSPPPSSTPGSTPESPPSPPGQTRPDDGPDQT